MENRIIAATLVAAFAFATPAYAQVANGNFDQGSVSWDWRDATYALAAGTNCTNVPYVAPASSSTKVRKARAAPASGNVGYLIPLKPYAVGTWGMCREMEQLVYVPKGASLQFALRIGDAVQGGFNAPQINVAGFSVTVVDGSDAAVVFSANGQSRPCDQWVPCPYYVNQTVDLAHYWGKHVRLVFRGSTFGQNTTLSQTAGEPSPIYVDNIRIQ